MKRRGVCYDVGTVFSGPGWRVRTRRTFDPAVTRRELEIIKTGLHCNAVRITGRDAGHLTAAARAALELGLEVWLSPALFEKSPDQTLAYYLAAARAAENLRRQYAEAAGATGAAAEPAEPCADGPDGQAGAAPHEPSARCALCPGESLCRRVLPRASPPVGPQVVFVLGGELSLFMRGIVPGRTIPRRLANLISQAQAGSGAHTELLNGFLARAAAGVRDVFGGPVTYASLVGEQVDWSPFDFVGVDHYRDARIKDRYAEMLRPLAAAGKPVVVTEVGMRGYQGAEDSGTLGFGVIDHRSQFLHQLPLAGRLVRVKLNGEYVRDEGLQARELADILGILETADVDGVFVTSFVEPQSPFSEDPRHDLDMSGLSLVKTYAGRRGTTYPDMTWEPKEAFRAVAGCYAGQRAGI